MNRPQQLLRLPGDRILVELLRLLMGNVGPSLLPIFPLLAIVLWMMSNPSNALGLWVWAAAVVVSRLVHVFHARFALSGDLTESTAVRHVWILIAINGLDGAIWAGLAWAGLDSATVVGTALVMAVMAGVTANAMAVNCVVMPVFVAFATSALACLGLKLWLMPDPAYIAMALISTVYVATLTAQGRNGGRVALDAITLRFENMALIQQLRIETDKAQAAHQEAEHANQAKTRFLAAASHDLRQPIHAQGLFLEVLSRSPLSPEQQEVLANARATSDTTTGMLGTLLDFSRIDAGVVEVRRSPFHLQPLLNKIDRELAPQALAQGLVLRLRETHAAIDSDPVLVEMMLRNLVSNAIRYTVRGGVLVGCRKRGDDTVLEVWDTGIGIEADQLQTVFREFHQLGNPERDREKGLGLGLAIVDGLARALGHALSVCSRPRRGSVFRLRLPNARATVVNDPLQAVARPMRRLDLHVLVIDDDAAVRHGMQKLLQSWGCDCTAVESIDQALAAAARRCPQLIISDYRLRDQSTGAQAIAAVRAHSGLHLPALLITGDTGPDRLREALASNIPLLHKPVSPTQLHEQMVQVMGG
ncbi:ATP-binding response regulator [Acidovorax radicis]|uniref:ATP-binding response regulator n=1 Tax=Acidovorax radicis TaxID=758826 RepID=UPI0002376DA3|nr:hybrid sensor histidine kinase/response regulator [Acidovorax radicis]